MSVIPEETVESEVVVDGGEEIIEEPAPDEGAEDEPVKQPEGEPEVAEPAPDGEEPDEDALDVADDDKPAEPVIEAVTFEPEMETPALVEKGAKVLDEYELPQPVQAYIDALQARAEADPMTAYSDYGDTDAVKTLLDRQSHIDSAREIADGQYRPNTDKFVEQIATGADGQNRIEWLYHDISATESTKYKGYSRFQENIVDALAVEGDTVSSAMNRYEKFIEAMRANALPDSTVPDFVPKSLHEAYFKLPRVDRDQIELLEAGIDDDLIEGKLSTLQSIQKGINGERAEEQRTLQAQAKAKQDYANEVIGIQSGFFNNFRSNFAEQLTKNVTFSTDAKLQSFLASGHVTVLEQAFDPSPAGDFARKSLSDAGIRFDTVKAQQLVKQIEQASILLATNKRAVDAQGQPLDPVSLNKAQRQFENAGREWQVFAKDILDQEARLTSTGKAEEIKQEVAKKKIEAKARAVPKGATTTATKREVVNPHPYGTVKYYEFQADQIIEDNQKRAAAQAAAYA